MPTEDEWEVAARYDGGWDLPYGNEFDEDKKEINVKAAKSCPAHAIEIYDEKNKKIV